MAKSVENLPKTIASSGARRDDSLEPLIARIRERTPPLYYSGRGPLEMAIPTNLLLFHRMKRSDLSGGGPSSHHRFVLVVSEAGSGTVVLDDVLVPLSAGQALLIFPYQHHHYTNLQQSRFCWLFITFELPRTEPLESLRYRTVPLSESARGHVRRICEHWLARRTPTAPDDRLLLEAALLLSEMLRQSERKDSKSVENLPASPGRGLLQSIGDYLNGHLDQPVQVTDLAEHVSLSESHLRSRFRRHFGMSLGKYVRGTKIMRAAQLLDTTELTVSEVAQACGFDSIYAFSRAFRRNMNVSPRQYRQRKEARN